MSSDLKLFILQTLRLWFAPNQEINGINAVWHCPDYRDSCFWKYTHSDLMVLKHRFFPQVKAYEYIRLHGWCSEQVVIKIKHHSVSSELTLLEVDYKALF